MSFSFSIGYRSPISSTTLNEKLHEVWGRNGVLSGFTISKHSNTQVKISTGVAVVRGVRVAYTEDNAGNPLKVNIPLSPDGKKYVYGIYNHKLSAFTIHVTDGKYDAQGEWKLFLGHAEVVAGALLNIQPIVEPEITSVESIYKRMPNMNELINFFFESTDQIGDQITNIINGLIGNMKTLKTNHKETVVGSINELFDTKEPTLTRDRILELLGGGNGNGNIDIDSINGIPIKDFVLKYRAIKTLTNSGLRGGGDLSVDRELNIDWGIGENQVPRGNHNHSGYHLDKKYSSQYGNNNEGAVYSQVAYYARKTPETGALKITLPKGFTNSNLGIEIKGYDSGGGNSAYTLQLGGITSLSLNSWDSCTADILGTAPFAKVSFGKDAQGKACIILGETDTRWSKGSLFISHVLVSGEDTSSWNAGWSLDIVSNTNGIIIMKTPTIITGGPQGGDFVPPNRSISAGTGLRGGGTLTRDITISADFGTGADNIARGNHTHFGEFLPSVLEDKNKVVVTDGTGKITTNSVVKISELEMLKGATSNIQTQLNNKSNTDHGHSGYVPFTGGVMKGSLSFGDSSSQKLSAHQFYIRGYRLTIASGEPSIKDKGTVWIDLPF